MPQASAGYPTGTGKESLTLRQPNNSGSRNPASPLYIQTLGLSLKKVPVGQGRKLGQLSQPLLYAPHPHPDMNQLVFWAWKRWAPGNAGAHFPVSPSSSPRGWPSPGCSSSGQSSSEAW